MNKKIFSLLFLCLPLLIIGHGDGCCHKKHAQTQVGTDVAQAEQTSHRTFALIKPDAVAAGNIGEIIHLIEKNGFTIVGMQLRTLTTKEAEILCAEHKDKPFFKEIVAYITSGPIVAFILEKENAVTEWRELIGTTDPSQARPGTIRKMYAESKSKNAVHGSDSAAAAEREIGLFFS
jgi:nucleoside-diphosphate kinase